MPGSAHLDSIGGQGVFRGQVWTIREDVELEIPESARGQHVWCRS